MWGPGEDKSRHLQCAEVFDLGNLGCHVAAFFIGRDEWKRMGDVVNNVDIIQRKE